MVSRIHLAPKLVLPADVVTQSISIVAKRRVGKSYLARRFTEQLAKADQQVVIVDPKGDWWGIRSSADGKQPGLPIAILGGEHGDLQIAPQAGAVVAQLVATERANALIDLSSFRKGEVATFMTSFLEDLYRLKAQERFRTPLMLVVDEADAIAPQKPMSGEERMLGALEDIVRRGGQRGLGCMTITQRTAVLNKNVLTQSQILVAMRTIAPQDLKAMKEWIDVHGTPEEREVLMTSLPSLPVGDAWFWSPGWPDERGIFQRVHVDAIETFDSGATPKPGQRRIQPKKVADVDFRALEKHMADTIAQARENDPKQLKAEVAKLRAEVAKLRAEVTRLTAAKAVPVTPEKQVVEKTQIKVVKVPIVTDKQLGKALATLDALKDRVGAAVNDLVDRLNRHKDPGEIIRTAQPTPPVAPRNSGATVPPAVRPTAPPKAPKPPADDGDARPLPDVSSGDNGPRRMLIALAQRPQGLAKKQLGARAGLSSNSGTFRNYMSDLRRGRWIVEQGPTIFISDVGIEAIGAYEPLPAGKDLLDYWCNELGRDSGASRMLRFLFEAHPNRISKAQLGEGAGISHESGTFRNYMSDLRKRELLDEQSGLVGATNEFFE